MIDDSGLLITLLGGFDLNRGTNHLALQPTAQRLVALVALKRQHVSRQAILGTLWAEESNDHARAKLRNALWRIRQVCPDLISATPASVSLGPNVVVDVDEQLNNARELSRGGHCSLSPTATLQLLSHELLPEWNEEWLFFERERLRQLRMHALETVSLSLSKAGQYSEAIEAGLAAVEIEPLRESAQRAVAIAHLAEGNFSEARRIFHEYSHLLHVELGVEPSFEFHALMHAHPISPLAAI